MQEERVIDLDKLTPAQLEAEDLLSQAILLINNDCYDEALERLQEAQKLNPNEVDIYLRQAQIHIIRENYGDAEAMLDKASYVNKQDGRINLHRGNVLFLRDKYAEAIEQFAAAEELGVKNATMYASMGVAYERTDRPDQALQAYSRAIRIDPDNPTHYVRRIELLLRFNAVDEADGEVTAFLKRFPNIREGYSFAVDILFRKDEYAKAEKLLNDVMADQGEDSILEALLVRTYALMDKRGMAIDLANKILADENADPDAKADALECLPRLYLMENQVDKGLELLKKTIAAEKDGAYNLPARSLQVTMLTALKRHKELLEAVEDIMSKPGLADELPMAYMLRGDTLRELGREAEAVAAYREGIIKLRNISIRMPASVDVRIFRAMCHKGVGEYEEALRELRIIESLKVDSAQFYEFRASIYEAMGDAPSAEADRKRAKEFAAK